MYLNPPHANHVVHAPYEYSVHRGQRTTSDPLKLVTVVSCWDCNPIPLKEQPMLLK